MEAQLEAWRRDVPALARTVHGRRLAYLDSAARALVPQAVIDAIARAYTDAAGNVGRGVHALAEAATEAFEDARRAVAGFVGGDAREVVFTSGATAAINLVADAWGRAHVGAGDAVVVTELEHHANFLPWQRLCAERGAELRVAPVDDGGRIDLDALAARLGDRRVTLISVAHLSNVAGTIAPIATIARLAHDAGARLLVDGAQAIAHLPVDVGALGCDFYAFSAHKLYGPTGTGVLWARAELMGAMPPWQVGGGMVAQVGATAAETRYRDAPARFEAGTPNLAGALGLAAAIAHVRGRDRAAVAAHEARVFARLRALVGETRGARILGEPEAALVAFTIDGAHAHDVATILDREGVAVRSGHHCAQPLHHRLGAAASVRASLAYYTGDDDLDQLAAGLARVREVLR